MSKEIVLTDSQIALYIPILKQEIREQEKAISELEKELSIRTSKLEENQNLLSQLTGNPHSIIADHVAVDSFSYSKDWTLVQKTEFVLRDHLEALSVRDICDALCELEPGIEGNRTPQVFRTTIAATLGNYAKHGNTFYKDGDDFPNKYGLLEWKKK